MDVKPEFLARIKSLPDDELRALTKVAQREKLDTVNDELQKRRDAAAAEDRTKSERDIAATRAQDKITATQLAIFATLSAIFVALLMWLLNG